METKKIAVMTWYTHRNYGTALQATALCHKIEELGYSPRVICYQPKPLRNEPTRRGLARKVVVKIKEKLRGAYHSEEREVLYADFLEERISLTSPCRSYSELYELNQQFDAFVCGSDQIWSPLSYDDKYYLSFVENPQKMVAYAPSMGVGEIKNPIVQKGIAELLRRYTHLSVREQKGAELIEALTQQKAEVVLDPTLLMTGAEWDDFLGLTDENAMVKEDYGICYFLGNSNRYMRYVKKLSNAMNMPFYVIPMTEKEKKSGQALPFEVGPCEIVSLIRNAKYVCTDSFHGMAFAVNYKVPFCGFKRFEDKDPGNQNSRIFNLLHKLALEERLVNPKSASVAESLLTCDFEEALRRLSAEKEFSHSYLAESLRDAVNASAEKVEEYRITDYCCGCGACAASCPCSAIRIEKNGEGFDHYVIDQSLCIQCGKCRSVCPMFRVTAQDLKDSLALYSMKSKRDEVLTSTSSGGVGYELALMAQREQKILFGCAYDHTSDRAKHILVSPDDKQGLAALRGSKYIQSSTEEVMRRLTDVAKEQDVVFFGTPCQVAAADRLLQKKGLREKALLVDLICHGVPSEYLWEAALRQSDVKFGTGTHPTVEFRSKAAGWHRRSLQITGNGKEYRKQERKDDFYAFFRRSLCDMKSCSECPYRERSAADVRIGDYWGERFLKDEQGVSMVIAVTERGRLWIDALEKNGVCDRAEHPLSEYWTVQYPYNLHRPLEREALIAELKAGERSLHDLRKEYCGYYDDLEFLLITAQKIKRFLK